MHSFVINSTEVISSGKHLSFYCGNSAIVHSELFWIQVDAQNVERARSEARERQELLHRRRLEELAAHNENAQRIREEGDGERRRTYQERQVLSDMHRQQVSQLGATQHQNNQTK